MLIIVMSFLHFNKTFFRKVIKFKYLYTLIIFIHVSSLNSSLAQEKVDIKGFDTDLFSRLVFSWDQPVEYQAEIQDKELTIRFNRSGSFEIEKIKSFLPKIVNFSSYDKTRNQIKIIFNNIYEIRTASSGSSVIFEIQPIENLNNVIDISNLKIKKNRSQLEDISGIRVRFGKHEKYSRIVFDWKDDVKYTIEKNLNIV
ncbi:MAG: hypothetical protein CFH01_01131, partial [Alphaproteobacteria bacterium MarineAlpha2_Bin1]